MMLSKNEFHCLLLFTHCPCGKESNDCCLGHLRATMSKQDFIRYIQRLPEEVLDSFILRHKKCQEERKQKRPSV